MYTLRLGLPELIGVKHPHSAVLFEDGARIHAGNARTAIARLAGVGRSANVDVEMTAIVEGQALVFMFMLNGQVFDDNLGRTAWL